MSGDLTVPSRGARLGLAALVAVLLAVGVIHARSEAEPAPEKPVARFAVVSFYNPRLMYLKYQPLIDYLTQQTPWRFELALSTSYRETVSRLCRGDVQLAYLGPYTYLMAREQCGAKAILRLNTGGREHYASYIMVREDSPVRRMEDLRGKAFGFGAFLSTSSHLMPRAMLLKAGVRPGLDVACRYFEHHERAARGVLMGEVQACGIRDLVGEQFKGRGLRILARSEPMLNFPLSVHPQAPDALVAALTEALVALPRRDPSVASVIQGWDGELSGGFAPVAPEAYSAIADLARFVFGPRAMSLSPELLACESGR
ncbi:MAG: phosphate/phosphite/phosphonate ABC transporter substrate-binding protein [Vicinamibacterales bacterium]|nr:phosphate/phosphite/phosphonate ABC transporter substrate-binding protein [Vicinamibacterales bacterium]